VVGVYFDILEWNFPLEEDEEDPLDERAELDLLVVCFYDLRR
jgi:hypothetical protein